MQEKSKKNLTFFDTLYIYAKINLLFSFFNHITIGQKNKNKNIFLGCVFRLFSVTLQALKRPQKDGTNKGTEQAHKGPARP